MLATGIGFGPCCERLSSLSAGIVRGPTATEMLDVWICALPLSANLNGMEKPHFQFGLRAVVVAMTGAAVLLAIWIANRYVLVVLLGTCCVPIAVILCTFLMHWRTFLTHWGFIRPPQDQQD